MLLLKMDQTFIYPFNSVLTTLLWARYSAVSHPSREGNQNVVYNSVTHSPLGGTQYDTQCHSGEAPGSVMRQESGELCLVSLLWFPWEASLGLATLNNFS